MTSVTNEVNKVYSRKNPSTYFRSAQDVESFINNRKQFLLRMKLPPKLFANSSLIDFGCGMGQNTLVYDHLGSNCTLLEYDDFSYNNALILFKKHAKNNFRIINTDIFDYDAQSESFDFVVSNGVAHHTKDPAQNIQLCCNALKPGGFFILGIGNKAGFFQRNIQRFILYSIANNNDDIVKYSKLLFRENLKRSVRFSGRKLDEIVYDTYINPKISAFGTAEVLRMFSENNIQLYSSYENIKDVESFLEPSYNQFRLRNPSGEPPKDSISGKGICYSDIEDISLSNNNKTHTQFYEHLRSLAPHFDAITDEVNDIKFDDFDINKTQYLTKINTYKKKLLKINKIDLINKTHNEIFFEELSAVITVLNKRATKIDKFREISILLKNTKKLFRLVNGVGMNYYCGYKNE